MANMNETYAEMSATLLRQAAGFFRSLGEENPVLKEQMEHNANVFEQVADAVEKDPTGRPAA